MYDVGLGEVVGDVLRTLKIDSSLWNQEYDQAHVYVW